MKIGIHTKELQNQRIDGTMVYLAHILRNMEELIVDDDVYTYHTGSYNARIIPMIGDKKYHDRMIANMPMWTQIGFARALWKDRCDVLWMPVHNVPYMRRGNMRVVVTIHDLAFKFFPDTYPDADRRKLNILTDHAVKVADDIIAISQTTKNDLLTIYPYLQEQHVHVIHHGFDPVLWQQHVDDSQNIKTLGTYHLQIGKYIIHVGAIQPRKNLIVLIDAFAQIKRTNSAMQLVLVGGDGWLAEDIHAHIKMCPYRDDIIVTGNINFDDVRTLMCGACVCVLPSLYEGFGMPGLEAMAAGVPVVAAENSCFPEILGEGAVYFDARSNEDCARAIKEVINDPVRTHERRDHAQKRATLFSWKTCAERTCAVLREDL